ncbi:hypothetical protein Zmor_013682 [Zophobas morio]|uniref:Smr domain-containing protein n=1 Tax=Zophobas morio TaxID=2755281 RepID=A0AA38IDE2_9CUCU|nr:hypothetical protein Zmor_013682 [Zophobas morio]
MFRGLFNGILDGFSKLCSCNGSSSLSDDTQVPGASTRDDIEFFSRPSLVVPTGFQPVIEIPVALGEQLYIAYVESTFRQQEAQNQIVQDLIKEDEEFARRLQDEENKYDKAQEARSLEPQAKSREEQLNKRKSELPLIHGKTNFVPQFWPQDDETDLAFEQPAASYREQAQQHIKKRTQFYKNAKQCLKVQNHKLANYYYQQAKEQTKLIEEANNRAAAAFLAENSERHSKNTIDLHHLFVREAIQALDNFLDKEITSLQDEHLKTKFLVVITGRGKHSRDGVPKIKLAVMDRLKNRKLKYSEINPGSLRVHIFKHSYLTTELM